jgi:hypothetical protein
MVMMFMAESPDRRLIEPAANMVNETLLRELFGARRDVEEGRAASRTKTLRA